MSDDSEFVSLVTIAAATGKDRGAIVDATINAVLKTTIDGASTLRLVVADPERDVLTSTADPLTAPSTATVIASSLEFYLAAVAKTGANLTLTFEDALVSALRSQTSPLTFRPGLTVDALAQLFAREAGVVIVTDPASTAVLQKNSGRSLGNMTTSSWAELGSIAAERGWRLFSDGTRVLLGSDAWLLTLSAPVDVGEEQDPVHQIDFNLDPGQRLDRVTLTVDTDDWTHDVGSVVNLTDSGPANGLWLVAVWNRPVIGGGTSPVHLSRSSTTFGS